MSDDRRMRRIESLRDESEELDQQLTVAEKKARIKALKREYGDDWKKVVGKNVAGVLTGSIKINHDALTTMYAMGDGGRELRSRNRPWGSRRA